MVLVVDGRTNTHAASPTILYRHLCICANLNSQTNAAQPVKCYYRELLRTQTRTHTHIWVLLTAVKQMNLCMRLTALSACGRYTKCSLSLVSSPCSKTLSLHSQYMLSCSFVLKAKQTSLFFSACIFLPIQTRRKQKKKRAADTQGREPRDFQYRVSNSIAVLEDWLQMSSHAISAWIF